MHVQAITTSYVHIYTDLDGCSYNTVVEGKKRLQSKIIRSFWINCFGESVIELPVGNVSNEVENILYTPMLCWVCCMLPLKLHLRHHTRFHESTCTCKQLSFQFFSLSTLDL